MKQVKYCCCCCCCWAEDGFMINKCHHTRGDTGNDHTDRQTDRRTGGWLDGWLGCVTSVKTFLTLRLFSPVKHPEVKRPDSPEISINSTKLQNFSSKSKIHKNVQVNYRSHSQALGCWASKKKQKHHLLAQKITSLHAKRKNVHASKQRLLSPLWSINTVHILPSQLIEAQRDLQELNCQRRVPRLKPTVLSVPTHVQLNARPVHPSSAVWL